MIKSLHVLNGGGRDWTFQVDGTYFGIKIKRIMKEDNNVFTVFLENGDEISVISNNVIVHWTNG
jgi:hypothetical protein